MNIQIFSIFAPEMIGLWCNGNTSDSGPDFPGSNPGSPTKKKQRRILTFFAFLFDINKSKDCNSIKKDD